MKVGLRGKNLEICICKVMSAMIYKNKRQMVIKLYSGKVIEVTSSKDVISKIMLELSAEGYADYADLTDIGAIILVYDSDDDYKRDLNKNEDMLWGIKK